MSRHPGTAPAVVPPRVLLDPAEVIDRLHATRERARQAAVEELDLAVEWALLHPCPPGEEPAQWSEGRLFSERVVPLAGPGAPVVAEFAPAALAAALGISFDAGRQLLADALELAYRLPRLNDLVHTGAVPAYVARTISRDTRDLSLDAVRHADRLLCAVPDKIGQIRARRLIDEARLWHDPDRAVEDERQALEARHVTLGRTGCPATREVHLLLDQQDAEAFDHTVIELASRLSDLGDPDPLDLRRARAVGILADPQRALDLLHGPADQQTRREIQDGRLAPVRPAERRRSSCTSPLRTSPSTSRPAPGQQSLSGWARSAWSCSRPGWPVAGSWFVQCST